MEVTIAPEEASEIDNLAAKLVADYGEVDPTLELSKFIFPHLDLLKNMIQGNYYRSERIRG